MRPESTQGKIVTFYSYKGGTGRSMALANIAWILASNRKKVFVIDWDLEAPGLHRYFRPFLIDKELQSSNGLIDIVHDYVDEIIRRNETSFDAQSPEFKNILDQFSEAFVNDCISLNHKFPDGGFIDFLPAGRQVATYAHRVNTFRWQEFYAKFGGGLFLESVKRRLREEYDYILIDSRTGVSDTSGISTVQMPDTLAVCFTYNNQSIAGAAAIARSVVEERQRFQNEQSLADPANMLRSRLRILPIPTRVEPGEREKLAKRQSYARQEFNGLLEKMSDTEREQYWSDVEIPYLPFHAYEESLAALTDNPSDKKLILGAVRRITDRLTYGEVVDYQQLMSKEDLEKVLDEFKKTPFETEANASSERTASVENQSPEVLADIQLSRVPADDLNACIRLWKRLVEIRAGAAPETLSSCVIEYAALGKAERRVAGIFIDQGLLGLKRSVHGTDVIEITADSLLRNWKTLHAWVAADRTFIIWRTQLSDWRRTWEASARSPLKLLAQTDIDTALAWRRSSERDLLPDDLRYIDESVVRTERKWNQNYYVRIGSMAIYTIVLTIVPISIAISQSKAKNEWQQSFMRLQQEKITPTSTPQPVPPPQIKPAVHESTPAETGSQPPGWDARRKGITVKYFRKASDPKPLSDALIDAGYRVEVEPAVLGEPSNSLWFGCQSPLSSADARIIGLILLEQGVELKQMKVFRGADRKLPLVELGAEKAAASGIALSRDDIVTFDLEQRCRANVAKS